MTDVKQDEEITDEERLARRERQFGPRDRDDPFTWRAGDIEVLEEGEDEGAVPQGGTQ